MYINLFIKIILNFLLFLNVYSFQISVYLLYLNVIYYSNLNRRNKEVINYVNFSFFHYICVYFLYFYNNFNTNFQFSLYYI